MIARTLRRRSRHAWRAALLLCLSVPLPSLQAQEALRFAGVNLSGAEIAPSKIPGVVGADYTYPRSSDYTYFAGKGMNLLRLPVRWERLQPQPRGPLDAAQLALIDDAVQQAKAQGMYVIVDIHNYARYGGRLIGSTDLPVAAFVDLWQRLARAYGSDNAVVFGLMNEPHGITPAAWATAAQAAVDAIRATGASNLILVPGALWTGAHSWYTPVDGTSNASALATLHDPLQRVAIEVHQYLDADSSGTSPVCVSDDIGVQRLRAFTDWLQQTGHLGFLGEFAAADNPTCPRALDGMLADIAQHPTLWLGWSYWAGGAWWRADYPFNVQPDADGHDRPQMAILAPWAQRITR
ncbi:glycoside hydrolase family 5 protein [Xanthomonas protegens]|uniref:Glycoside hydrolase family 5 protein n=1 Tax=Xanthomonas protegens TaxID=3380705 RepID=A0ABU9L9U9_9XANT